MKVQHLPKKTQEIEDIELEFGIEEKNHSKLIASYQLLDHVFVSRLKETFHLFLS